MARDDVDGVGAAPDEHPAVGHHSTDRWWSVTGGLNSGEQLAQPGRRECEQSDVVLAQVRPPGRRVRERGSTNPARNPPAGPVFRSSRTIRTRRLELGVVESAVTVDHHHDPLGREAFVGRGASAPRRRPGPVAGR